VEFIGADRGVKESQISLSSKSFGNNSKFEVKGNIS
jgi:hypothetical protein